MSGDGQQRVYPQYRWSKTRSLIALEPVTAYGPNPVDVQCPYCHNFCRTRIRSTPTSPYPFNCLAVVFCFNYIAAFACHIALQVA
ncbi:hypothetical protein DOY81_009487 [Sarcophaga bullata]|nr:hypothetical protein DOY81_009487 [Sarcophaga bullata]